MMNVGRRVSYWRRGNLYCGVIEAIDQGSIAGTFYWVRNDASQIRNTVLPEQIIGHE